MEQQGCVMMEAPTPTVAGETGAGTATPRLLVDTKLSLAGDQGPARPPSPAIKSAAPGPPPAAAAAAARTSSSAKKSKKKRSRKA